MHIMSVNLDSNGFSSQDVGTGIQYTKHTILNLQIMQIFTSLFCLPRLHLFNRKQ